LSEENSSLVFTPAAEDAGKRLDAFLAEKIDGWSRSRLQKLIDDGDVLVNDKAVKSSYRLDTTDEIEVELVSSPSAGSFAPEDIPLEIVFEDDDIAVINKPAGMVVHPGAGVSSGTLANALAFHFAQLSKAGGETRPGIVHRLDKDTSGLIVVAKNEAAHENLSEQFSSRSVFKSYLALVHGQMDAASGTVEAALARDRVNRLKMTVARSGRYALSLWRVRESFQRFTLLEVQIKTGRTHQIRVHLAHIKHPVAGDEIYNGGRDNTVADQKVRKAIAGLGRFFLHAEKLRFAHPRTGDHMSFVAPLPSELAEFLDLLRLQ
jgi:23S rRNA pseudouridine1911/1915/1917 synthase